jgi:hypothetical protein
MFVLLLVSGFLLARWMGWLEWMGCYAGAAGVHGGGYADDDGDDDGSDYDALLGGGQFRLKVSDPEYTALLEKKKTVELRPDRPPFSRLKEGDTVTVVRARPKDDTSEYPGGKYKHESVISRITKHHNLESALKAETLAKVYPGKSAAEAAERYKLYLPPGAAAGDPILAIELKLKK